MCKLNPRVDFVFKKLFGSEENKDILIDFINSIVGEEDQVKDIQLKNPYNDEDFKKLCIIDIRAKDVKGNWFNIEIQLIDQEYYAQMFLYYWSKLYVSQLVTGINYDRLEKTICINIHNFSCLKESHYHNEYRLLNLDSGQELIKHLQIHFVELEKYDEKISNLMDRWVNFLKKAGEYTESDLPTELMNTPSIQKAITILNTMQLNSIEREHFEARLKWLRDKKAALIYAEKKGYQQGMRLAMQNEIQQDSQKNRFEIVKKMLENEFDPQKISDITGMTTKEIEELKKHDRDGT